MRIYLQLSQFQLVVRYLLLLTVSWYTEQEIEVKIFFFHSNAAAIVRWYTWSRKSSTFLGNQKYQPNRSIDNCSTIPFSYFAHQGKLYLAFISFELHRFEFHRTFSKKKKILQKESDAFNKIIPNYNEIMEKLSTMCCRLSREAWVTQTPSIKGK